MNDEMRTQVIETVKDVMGVDIGKMNEQAKFSSISSWDSFNNLMLISKFEEELKVKFTALEIEQTQTVGDLFSLLKKKTAKK